MFPFNLFPVAKQKQSKGITQEELNKITFPPVCLPVVLVLDPIDLLIYINLFYIVININTTTKKNVQLVQRLDYFYKLL